MSYGLYDGDLIVYPQVPFFNLELMKLSSYYKSKREIVSFSPTFSPNMYKHFLIRQDYTNNYLPILKYNNIEYGGRAIYGDEYQPLPLEIESCKPDRNLYDKIEFKVYESKTGRDKFKTMKHAEHLRLSLDNKTVWKDYERQLHKSKGISGLIFHDYNLETIDNSLETVKELISYLSSEKRELRIGMKFPVQTTTEERLIKWMNFLPMGYYYSVDFNGILTLDNVEIFKELKKKSTSSLQTTINPTRNITYNDFINEGLQRLLRSIVDLRNHRLVFPLKYDKEFFADIRWAKIMDLFVRFNNHIKANLLDDDYFNRVVPYETFYNFVKTLTKRQKFYPPILKKQEAEKLFQFVRETNYNLFIDFYEYTGEK